MITAPVFIDAEPDAELSAEAVAALARLLVGAALVEDDQADGEEGGRR